MRTAYSSELAVSRRHLCT